MQVIVLAARKGGAGKSQISQNLAICADRAGYATLLFDLDSQATLSKFGARRGSAPDVVESLPPTLGAKVAKAKSLGVEIVIIDTPPSAGEELRLAIEQATVVLIPCQPSINDIEAVGVTAGVARGLNVPARIILNGATPRSSLTEEARDAITSGGGIVAPVVLHARTAFKRAAMAGQSIVEYEPGGKGASEITDLWAWLCKDLGIPATKGAEVKEAKAAKVKETDGAKVHAPLGERSVGSKVAKVKASEDARAGVAKGE